MHFTKHPSLSMEMGVVPPAIQKSLNFPLNLWSLVGGNSAFVFLPPQKRNAYLLFILSNWMENLAAVEAIDGSLRVGKMEGKCKHFSQEK